MMLSVADLSLNFLFSCAASVQHVFVSMLCCRSLPHHPHCRPGKAHFYSRSTKITTSEFLLLFGSLCLNTASLRGPRGAGGVLKSSNQTSAVCNTELLSAAVPLITTRWAIKIKLRLYDSERPFGMKTLKICPTTDQMLRCTY